jgi:tetratricopeptide (TPR) repeat protein
MLTGTSMPEKVPRIVAHVDVRKFKLDPMDGFLLTRVDGKLGPKDLARETGLPDFSVDRSIDKLVKLGVLEMIDPNAPPPPALPPAEVRKPELPQFASLEGEVKYDPKQLEENCDLPHEQRKRVLDFFYRLDDLDHYTLLGVTREADKKTVKRSYFELASVMHPDRYFKKNLGSFKPKMEILFARVTEAHDTLVDAAKRLDYDAYLDEVATTRGMEAMLERALEESRQAAAVAVPATVPATEATNGRTSVAPVPKPARGPSPEELQARRHTLAKRLLGGRPPTASQPAERLPSERPDARRYSSTGDAMDALKRRYEDHIENATLNQARKYVKAAEDALSKNDVVAASSAFGIAVKFAPNDVDLATRYQEVKNQADKILCDSYVKQAQYEERAQHWQEAARNWQKVTKIRPLDAKAQERAAHAMLKVENADLRVAAEHVKVAITADPQNVAYHVTLAEVYLKAGLATSAKRAAEVGLQIDPKNAALLGVVKKAGKGS